MALSTSPTTTRAKTERGASPRAANALPTTITSGDGLRGARLDGA